MVVRFVGLFAALSALACGTAPGGARDANVGEATAGSMAEPGGATAAGGSAHAGATGSANGGVAGTAAGGAAAAGVGGESQGGAPAQLTPSSLAVIGDTPYGVAQLKGFGALVAAINADSQVSLAVHVGDFKDGGTLCDDAYFQTMFGHFSNFSVPLVYTPGDNDWTDCHRASNGAYDPLERLAALRKLFFASPAASLGLVMPMTSQPSVSAFPMPENRVWEQSGVVLASVHVVGSLNGLAPWFGDDTTGKKKDDPARRIAEATLRRDAAVDFIGYAFGQANSHSAAGVVFFMQADTFNHSPTGFTELIQALAQQARDFKKPVLLVQGDSHVYLTDTPLATGSVEYAVDAPVPNLTRIVVQGQTASEWLKLRIDPGAAQLFSWQRVKF